MKSGDTPLPYSKLIGLVCLALVACGGASEPEAVQMSEQALAGQTASGVVPAGMPARVAVGLFEDTGGTWMKSSAVKWDARYR
jgi:hypothetical protein